MASAFISPLEFAEYPHNITAGEPAGILWSSNGHPANLTLCLSGSLGHSPVSVLVSDFGGDYFSWTPTDLLSDGTYSLELSQQIPQQNEVKVFSQDVTLGGGRGNEEPSDSSKAPKSDTAFLSSTISTGTASSTQSSATGSTGSLGILASGRSSSLGPASATVTSPAETPASSSQSPDVPKVSLVQHSISDGTIAAIVVGAVVFIIVTTASAMLCWRRRRRLAQTSVSELPDHQTDTEVKSDPTIWIPELDQEGAVYGPHELAGTPTPLAESLRSLEASDTQHAEGRISEMADTE